MATQPTGAALHVALESWAPVHPAAVEFAGRAHSARKGEATSSTRSAVLAQALADSNRRWGNPVDGEVSRWLAGSEVVVTGQQPGLLGGPLLTLVKAAAVAAEVRLRRAAGRDAVGFLWLATADDDLPEMGWGRVAAGDEVAEVREPGWDRGGAVGGLARLSGECAAFVAALTPQLTGENARQALDLAGRCYAEGALLGEATATFLARLLAGTGVVLVDALSPAVAVAAAETTARALERLPRLWETLAHGGERFRARGWTPPLRISPQRLPVFRRVGERRETVPTERHACPSAVLAEHEKHPERFIPNAWLRPLVADAALGTTVSVLGGAELAYHLQTEDVRSAAGVPRPEWRLRPHVTIVTPAERRLAGQLKVGPADVLRPGIPLASLPGKATRRRVGTLRAAVAKRVDAVAASARAELPGLTGDVDATARKLDAAVGWLEDRLAAAAARDAEVTMARWRRLRAFLRPDGQPQERRLSVLAPLLRLGLAFPGQLVEALDPNDPGMHLLFWGEGGRW
ncbi:MAG TPA: bacillithiol biosynthesis BshC [Thermoanaerobaculaceae bacterium]|nr:bacillithiol biosynthesis BshC [Thermoanaerobaculaceae bacterium]